MAILPTEKKKHHFKKKINMNYYSVSVMLRFKRKRINLCSIIKATSKQESFGIFYDIYESEIKNKEILSKIIIEVKTEEESLRKQIDKLKAEINELKELL
jgi:hypothetical protein